MRDRGLLSALRPRIMVVAMKEEEGVVFAFGGVYAHASMETHTGACAAWCRGQKNLDCGLSDVPGRGPGSHGIPGRRVADVAL